MNIYQMRHAILAKHIGERVTPAQLKAELLESFPGVKPQSVNASDCHYSDRKRAGSTCPECGKVGGFVVNRDGVVDMGASGWGAISPVYVPTGNTRSSGGPSAGIAAATRKTSMSDPLVGFEGQRCTLGMTGPAVASNQIPSTYVEFMQAPQTTASFTTNWYRSPRSGPSLTQIGTRRCSTGSCILRRRTPA